MAEVFNFNLKAEEYLSLADKSFKTADIEKSVIYVGKALEIEPKNVEALLFLASIYSELGSYDLSNRVLYKAYTNAATDLEKTSTVAALVNNFYELGDDEAAEFYLNSIKSKWEKFAELSDFEVVGDLDEDNDADFSLVYPRTEEFYYDALERAHEALQDRDYESTLKELEVFEYGVPFYDASNHLRLVCYLLQDDVDRVIDEAGEILKKSDYLPVRCTLVTAYMIEEKNETALQLLDEILQKDYKRVEEITVLLPILVNFEMHAEVVKYTKRLLELSELQPHTMIWLAQGLYNLGQKTEASKVMRRVSTIYRDFTAADFYIGYFAKKPEKVEYGLGLPLTELVARQTKIRNFLKLADEDCRKELIYNKKTSELIKWCFRDIEGKSLLAIVSKLNDCWSTAVETQYAETLLIKDVDLNLGSAMLKGLILHKTELNMYITLEGKCKQFYLQTPDAIRKLPSNFINAFSTAVYETLVNVDNPNESLAKITSYINSFCTLDEKGKLEWSVPHGDKVARLKSTRTLLGIFIMKSAFADENEIKSLSDFFEINERTMKKYLRLLSGEGND
ncbi:MAG TPA: hypothetical protein VJZ69_00505 [Clostridia bacterium]|nr:hypothetical protein [Clostridia bacterium]